MYRYNTRISKNAISMHPEHYQTNYGQKASHTHHAINIFFPKKVNIRKKRTQIHKITRISNHLDQHLYKTRNWPRNHSSVHIVESSSDVTWTEGEFRAQYRTPKEWHPQPATAQDGHLLPTQQVDTVVPEVINDRCLGLIISLDWREWFTFDRKKGLLILFVL